MKDRRRTPLTFLALFLCAYIGIDNQWEPVLTSQTVNDDDLHQRQLIKGTTANNTLVGDDTTRSITSSGTSRDIVQEEQVMISGKQFTYRYPRTFSATMSDTVQNMEFVVGVLSAADGQGAFRREGVRHTWSKDHKGRVYFMVAGNWSNIEKEFETEQDLIWIDMEEKWWHLTYKVQTLYHAVEHHFGLPYEYIMKTDDDSYVFLKALNSFFKKYKGDLEYGGHCVSHTRVDRQPGHRYHVPTWVYSPAIYPPYATGEGYFVSKDFNKCLLDHIATLDYMPMEDCATGILAKQCHSPCTSMNSIFVKHHIKTSHRMQSEEKKWDFMNVMSERSQLRMLIQ